MEREKIIAGNWKMYKTSSEAVDYIKALAPVITSAKGLVFLSVPYTAIDAAVKASENTNIIIGAQNMFYEKEGAFTGEISGLMLRSLGAEFVILGHSERRTYFHEDDAMINKKLIRALKDGLRPILCIGETLAERESRKTFDVLKRSLKEGIRTIAQEDAAKIVVAYEPVWAIGTGRTATAEIAEEAHKFIRKTLEEIYSKNLAGKVPLLYGGSVKPANIKELIDQPDIDGALVGGASLDPQIFAEIINAI